MHKPFIMALCVTEKGWKLRCPSIGDWVNKLSSYDTATLTYNTTIKMKISIYCNEVFSLPGYYQAKKARAEN